MISSTAHRPSVGYAQSFDSSRLGGPEHLFEPRGVRHATSEVLQPRQAPRSQPLEVLPEQYRRFFVGMMIDVHAHRQRVYVDPEVTSIFPTFRRLCATAVVLLERIDPRKLDATASQAAGLQRAWREEELLLAVFRLTLRLTDDLTDDGGCVTSSKLHHSMVRALLSHVGKAVQLAGLSRRLERELLEDIGFAAHATEAQLEDAELRMNVWFQDEMLRNQALADGFRVSYHPADAVLGGLTGVVARHVAKEALYIDRATEGRLLTTLSHASTDAQSPASPRTPAMPMTPPSPHMPHMLQRPQVQPLSKIDSYFPNVPADPPEFTLEMASEFRGDVFFK